MAKKKYYAVKVGVKPGIYDTWAECQKMTKGYPGAIFKSFDNLEDAKGFAANDENTYDGTAFDETRPYAFVDGSFNASTGAYGYGAFLMENGNKHTISGCGDDKEMSAMRNVSGEVLGAMAAVELAVSLGIKELDIYYDYLGIEMWATGGWKRNKKGTIAYYEYMKEAQNKIKLNFVKVKGHSGVEGNEEVDRLAKKAVGIE